MAGMGWVGIVTTVRSGTLWDLHGEKAAESQTCIHCQGPYYVKGEPLHPNMDRSACLHMSLQVPKGVHTTCMHLAFNNLHVARRAAETQGAAADKACPGGLAGTAIEARVGVAWL
jgi:hypothetical protein